jgi:hypothetical protein
MKILIKSYAKWIVIIPVLCLCGCVSPIALDKDYNEYSQYYGDAVNRQLLLNLARESKGDPAYFLQLGSIQSQYSINTAATISPAYVFRHTPASISGSAQAGITQQPNFQFLPLTGSNYVQAVLSPISDRVFWTLYDQGWPANWLIRTMVDSITKTSTNYASGTKVEVYVNDPSDPTYPAFLTYCDGIFHGQLLRTLIMKESSGEQKEIYESTNSKSYKLSELISAIGNGLSVTWTNNGPVVKTKSGDSYELVTNWNNNFNIYTNYIGSNFIFSTQEAFNSAKNFVTNFDNAAVTFKMRTFESIMNAVASEESMFNDSTNPSYRSTNIVFTNDGCGPIAIVFPSDGSCSFTNRPIISISDKSCPGFSKLIGVKYKDVPYCIGDFTNGTEEVVPGYDYQNREVFTLLSYLCSQIAIDTSKLPVQQLIQVQ